MAAAKGKQAKKDEEAPPAPPAFYVATADLMVGHPASGAMPVAAYRAGDQVPAQSVADHPEWGELVYDPAAQPEPKIAGEDDIPQDDEPPADAGKGSDEAADSGAKDGE